ncbi:hypothetical protein V5O48_017036, partial [Marasmius crinis-equi]
GAHVRDIASLNGLDSRALARFLRYLSSVHVYRELSPDVFANNRVSAMLDTGKSVKELFHLPETKHDNTSGFPAFLSHQMDEVAKGAMFSWETVIDPAYPSITPLNKAFPVEARHNINDNERKEIGAVTIFDLLQRPKETDRHRRFAVAMEGMSGIQSLDCLSRAYDWDALPRNAIVVDVGGGVGTISLELAKRYPDLKLVVQDLPGFIEKGKELWTQRLPEALSSGRVALQAHDFFTPQPEQDATIFLLRHVVHNWSDEDSVKILGHLRRAARNNTKLLLLEIIMPYACRIPKDHASKSEIPGAVPEEAPAPLLANFGVVNEFAHLMDMTASHWVLFYFLPMI